MHRVINKHPLTSSLGGYLEARISFRWTLWLPRTSLLNKTKNKFVSNKITRTRQRLLIESICRSCNLLQHYRDVKFSRNKFKKHLAVFLRKFSCLKIGFKSLKFIYKSAWNCHKKWTTEAILNFLEIFEREMFSIFYIMKIYFVF